MASSDKGISLALGNGVKIEFVLIPAGEFMMGSNRPGEKPIHSVKISKSFYMSRFLVTQAQYQAVMDNNPSTVRGDDLPIDSVKFSDAEDFCSRASKIVGKRIGLPTEAEWEYACRAGTTTKFNICDDDSELDQTAWYQGNSEGKPHPVGQKKPNSWGLYDMHGNIWEWCQDWYAEDYYSQSPSLDPPGPASGTKRVTRGGCWNSTAWSCRSAQRNGSDPAWFQEHGFRVIVRIVSK
jgi:formylglycine-generating enzyme required for sulfatase activity